MKKMFLLFIAIFLVQPLISQTKKTPILSSMFFSVGYGNASSNVVNEYYDAAVESFRYMGVPLQTQTQFGETALVNAGIMFSLLKSINAGFSIGYSYLPAYSNYKDYMGSLKVNGSMNIFDLMLRVQYNPVSIGNFRILLNGQIGVYHVSLTMNKEIRFINSHRDNYDWEMTKAGWGPGAQFTAGTSIDVKTFTIGIEGGFKYSEVQVIPQTETTSAGSEEINYAMDIGPSGYVFLLTFGFNL